MLRGLARAVVRRLPVGLADAIRRPLPPQPPASASGRARLALLRVLREGGIPAAVSSFRLPDNPQLRFTVADSLVLSQLYWYGEQGWEPELIGWWRHFCRRSRAVLELGANVGYFAVQGGLAAPRARYVAVEPHPFSLRVCRANLALNSVGSVEVVDAAAVADPDARTVRLLVPSDQLATPTVAYVGSDSELPPPMAAPTASAVDVPAVDVRSLLPGVDLLKLDVEGQEHTLLAAGRELLRERRPTIFVEVLAGTPRLRALLADLCRRDGYRCYVPTRERLVELATERLGGIDLRSAYGTHDLIVTTAAPPASVAR